MQFQRPCVPFGRIGYGWQLRRLRAPDFFGVANFFRLLKKSPRRCPPLPSLASCDGSGRRHAVPCLVRARCPRRSNSRDASNGCPREHRQRRHPRCSRRSARSARHDCYSAHEPAVLDSSRVTAQAGTQVDVSASALLSLPELRASKRDAIADARPRTPLEALHESAAVPLLVL